MVSVLIVATVAVAGCKKEGGNPFPDSGAIAGWEKTSGTRVFEAKDLWQYIDGDSEQYLQAGVVTTATSDYKFQGHLEAVVDVYTMGDSSGARKVFENGPNSGAQTASVGDAAMAYEQSVTFRKGRYLVRIVAYQGDPGTQQALLTLAHGVESNL